MDNLISRQAVDNLRRYVDGKENTEKVEINVLQLNRIIKALEQEPKTDVLEDIKAEIEQIATYGQIDDKTSFIRDGEMVKKLVLEIIDKHIERNE